MFSADYPFEKLGVSTRFIQEARLSEAERTQVASGNAKRIMLIDRPVGRLGQA
jgi:predicted TIM-barrel fold metal-dependent hydrolase